MHVSTAVAIISVCASLCPAKNIAFKLRFVFNQIQQGDWSSVVSLSILKILGVLPPSERYFVLRIGIMDLGFGHFLIK